MTTVRQFALIFAGIALCFALGMSVISWQDHASYAAGTPTTAAVTYCGSKNVRRNPTGATKATWSIRGVSQKGPVGLGWFDNCSVGSSLDVRISRGVAYPASLWTSDCVVLGGLLVVSIVLFALGCRGKRRQATVP